MAGIAVKTLSFTKGDARRLNYSIEKLRKYHPPFVVNAEKEISKMLNGADLHFLEINHAHITAEVLELQSNGDLAHAKEILASPLFAASDYKLQPELFYGINTAILKCFGIRGLGGKNILQVASNWGPYMHYLKHEHGVNAHGIDTNEIAVKYAKLSGLDFTLGDARKMDFFKDRSFDAVISRNFLDSSYLDIFFFKKYFRDSGPFIKDVMSEIHRILRPDGFFISQNEDIESIPSANAMFRSFSRLELFASQTVDILQK